MQDLGLIPRLTDTGNATIRLFVRLADNAFEIPMLPSHQGQETTGSFNLADSDGRERAGQSDAGAQRLLWWPEQGPRPA
ncbi:hypothetical protein FQN55_009279 [Onygenales sp. PD_40]|nr:hypothetical protein FQN55_009279 [Onygenales sp. PD_40]